MSWQASAAGLYYLQMSANTKCIANSSIPGLENASCYNLKSKGRSFGLGAIIRRVLLEAQSKNAPSRWKQSTNAGPNRSAGEIKSCGGRDEEEVVDCKNVAVLGVKRGLDAQVVGWDR
jgi:hypothetical protein